MANIDYKIAKKDETDMTAQTLAAHLAESAKKHINTSGGNSPNGYYMKFDDGTMIQYKMGSFVVPTLNQGSHNLWRNANIGNFEFPVTFQTVIFAEMKILAAEEINIAIRSISESYINASLTAISDITGTTRNYYLFAIGRWK